MFKVSVFITPKAGIADPQGATIERALPNLGFEGVGQIRVGRYITLEVDGADEEVVRKDVDAMCRQLLANPIIEDYRFVLVASGPFAEVMSHSDEVVAGERAVLREAPEHAAGPWTVADPYAAGAAASDQPSDEAGQPAAPSPWTAADPFADPDGAGERATQTASPAEAGEGAPSPWTAADPYASREEEVE